MMWLDVLDLPMVAALDAVFFEEGRPKTPTRSVADPCRPSERRYGQGPGLVPPGPARALDQRPHSPLMVYRWTDTDAALDAAPGGRDAPDADVRYRDPSRDRDVMPTMRCEMRRVVAGHDHELPTSRPEPASARCSTEPARSCSVARRSTCPPVTSSSCRRGAPHQLRRRQHPRTSSPPATRPCSTPLGSSTGASRMARVSRHRHVLIVGGGIGGLGAPRWRSPAPAARSGWSSRPREFAEIGAGLQLGPNAMRAFDRLGVLDAVARAAVLPARGRDPRRRHGSTSSPCSTSGQAVPHAVRLPVRRRAPPRRARSALLDACRAEPRHRRCENNRTAVDVREARRARRGHLRRRRDLPAAHLLVGADGIRSRVRHLSTDSEPRLQRPRRLPRHDLPSQDVATDPAPDDVTLWIGPGIHLMQYPVRRGATVQPGRRLRAPSRRGRAARRRRRSSTPPSPSPTAASASRVALLDSAPGLAGTRPRSAADLDDGARGAARRRRPRHAAVPRAGRLPGLGGRGRPRPTPSPAHPRPPGPGAEAATKNGASPEHPVARPWPARGATCGTPRTRRCSPCAIGCSGYAGPTTTPTSTGSTPSPATVDAA